jgi:TIR domain
VTGYAFNSSSHYDQGPYVERLAAYLESHRVAVWYDKEIIAGDRWVRVIEQNLGAASAVIAVMTPAGDESRWVHRELDKAEELDIPIFPLLVAGTKFFRLSDTCRYSRRTTGRAQTPL